LAPAAFDGCSLEVKDQHFFGREIRSLYDSELPIRRRSAKSFATRSELFAALSLERASPIHA
jgi:hypothetical protein